MLDTALLLNYKFETSIFKNKMIMLYYFWGSYYSFLFVSTENTCIHQMTNCVTCVIHHK